MPWPQWITRWLTAHEAMPSPWCTCAEQPGFDAHASRESSSHTSQRDPDQGSDNWGKSCRFS
jgi:hypothetical protein